MNPRCYDCGQPIPANQLVRRDVAVAGTAWYGAGYNGGTAVYGRVDLCLNCNKVRDEADRRQQLWVLIAVLVFVFGPMLFWFLSSMGP